MGEFNSYIPEEAKNFKKKSVENKGILPSEVEPMTFEEKAARLAEIVRKIERGIITEVSEAQLLAKQILATTTQKQVIQIDDDQQFLAEEE